MKVEEALALIQEKRSFAQPNRLFMQQLQRFYTIVSNARCDAKTDESFTICLRSKLQLIDVCIDKFIHEADKDELKSYADCKKREREKSTINRLCLVREFMIEDVAHLKSKLIRSLKVDLDVENACNCDCCKDK